MSKPGSRSRRTAFVTGATGFVGRHLVNALVEKNWDVYALVHKQGPETLEKQASLNLVTGNLADLSALESLMSHVDVVYHLAAFIPPDQRDPQYAGPCVEVNALGTLRLAEVVLRNPACRFVHFSTANLYQIGGQSATETSPLYPIEHATYYLGSKILGELYVEHLRHTRKLDSVTLRLSSVYGLGMPQKSVVANFVNLAIANKPLQVWDGGRACWDYVYIDDVVDAAIQAGQSGGPGIYNVGSGRSRSTLELAELVANSSGDCTAKIEVMPATTEKPFVLPLLSIKKAETTWHYIPMHLEQGLDLYRSALLNEEQV